MFSLFMYDYSRSKIKLERFGATARVVTSSTRHSPTSFHSFSFISLLKRMTNRSRWHRQGETFVRKPWIPLCIIPNRSCKPNPQYSHVLCVHCSAVAELHQGAPPSWLRPAYCFTSVIVWTENKNVYNIWPFYSFYFDSETISGVGDMCFEGVNFFVNFFWGKNAPRRNSWLRPWLRVIRLEDFLTSKRPGYFTALVPPLPRWQTGS